jgi:hypothetical protein
MRERPYKTATLTHFLLEVLHQNNGMNTVQRDYVYVKDQLPRAVAARIQISRGAHLKAASPAAASQPATQVSVLSSSELGGDIVLGEPSAFP